MKTLLPILLYFSLFPLLHCFDTNGMKIKPSMVKRGERKTLMESEYGEITAVDLTTGKTGSLHLEFITMEPNSLFLPVLLHSDMVFYVNSGSGKLSWAEDGKPMKTIDIKKGDVFRLNAGSVFFLQSDLENQRQKLRVYSVFSNSDEDIYVPAIGAYSSVSDLVLGFNKEVLTSAFNVGDDVAEEMISATKPAAIVHVLQEKKKSVLKDTEERLVMAVMGKTNGDFGISNKKHKNAYNILEAKPDFENCNGWSVTVDRKDMKSLRHSNIGVFMVNLTKGSMMGPHWNLMATEIGIVLQGEGMIRVVCPGNSTDCKNVRFRVKEGDVFTVPRFHPMAQMAFNNDTFVFMGFSTSTRRNYPQFLAGKRSVLGALDRDVLGLAFNVSNLTVEAMVSGQEEAVILECTSCAEAEEMEMVKEWEEEERRQEEEERKRKEEEERKRKEEEERRRREEEERKREEEEERKRQEEEERRRQEEEERKREEEEERRRQEEEEERKREEEEERRRQEEEEERKREEEEERRQQEEEEERRRKEEEEERRKEEEERRKEEEEERRREEEEEREREREAAEEQREEQKRKREERARREQEQARREQEERKRKRRQREKEKEEEEEEERERSREEEEGEEREQPDEEEGRSRMAARRMWKVYL